MKQKSVFKHAQHVQTEIILHMQAFLSISCSPLIHSMQAFVLHWYILSNDSVRRQQRLRSDLANVQSDRFAQSDLGLHCRHTPRVCFHLVWFISIWLRINMIFQNKTIKKSKKKKTTKKQQRNKLVYSWLCCGLTSHQPFQVIWNIWLLYPH